MKRLILLSCLLFVFQQTAGAKTAVFSEPVAALELNPINFYPIGWSKDGKFAYILFQDWADSIGSCVYFRVFVQNLVDDRIEEVYAINESDNLYIFFKDYGINVKEDDDTDRPGTGEIFHAIWKKDGTAISIKLKAYGIVQGGTTLQKFPYEYKETSVECYFVTDKTDENDAMDFHNTFELWANIPGKGKKMIANSTNDMFLNAEIAGYLKSPYEDRIAVVLLKVYRSWEGPPSLVEPYIFGCHLTKGFK